MRNCNKDLFLKKYERRILLRGDLKFLSNINNRRSSMFPGFPFMIKRNIHFNVKNKLVDIPYFVNAKGNKTFLINDVLLYSISESRSDRQPMARFRTFQDRFRLLIKILPAGAKK
jgi:hypothetical protein